jgi:hypothetical protein
MRSNQDADMKGVQNMIEAGCDSVKRSIPFEGGQGYDQNS